MAPAKQPSKRLVVTAVLVVLVLGLVFLKQERLPGYNGRNVAQWFRVFIARGGHGQWLREGGNKEATDAIIVGLGEDALPFLTRVVTRHPRWLETKAYDKALRNLPRAIAKQLPAPRPDSRIYAIHLIGAIGSPYLHQRWHCKGDPVRSTQSAVATLKIALRKPVLREAACQAIEGIGPAARETLPDLLALLANVRSLDRIESDMLLRPVGALRSSASNAVPLLTQIVEDKALVSAIRRRAAFTLGEIGAPARSASPAVGRLTMESLLSPLDPKILGLELPLASLGAPAEAIPELERIRRDGGPFRGALASVALWGGEPTNRTYTEKVAEILRAPLEPDPGGLAAVCAAQVLHALACYGTNAYTFEVETRALACSSPQPAKALAQRLLENID